MTTARAQDILDWLHQVFQEHDKSLTARGDAPVVLPSSLAEREQWMPLLNEAFRAADGILVDATKCGSGAECGDIEAEAPTLVALIKTLLDRYNESDEGAELVLKFSEGRAIVEGAAVIDSVNAAQRAIREVATAMCDVNLRSSELVCVVYDEGALDPEFVSLVWHALTGMVDHINATPATTVCVVAGDSRMSIGIHCAGKRSLRYRIDDEQVQVRHPYDLSVRAIKQLGLPTRNDAPLIVLFLGAGASAADGLPMGDDLRNRALSDLMETTVDDSNFLDIAKAWYGQLEADGRLQDYEVTQGQQEFVRTLTLERVLEHEQAIQGTANCTTIRRFAEGHAKRYKEIERLRNAGELADEPMVRLCRHRQRLVLVTVNFDRFIEARAGADVKSYYTASQLEQFPDDLATYITEGGAVPLLKLHGDVDAPETLVATIGETNAGLNDPRQKAIQALVTAVNGQAIKPWWYLGYSMRDRDLESIWRGAEFPGFDEHWVAPFLDPNVEEFIKKGRVIRWQAIPALRQRTAQERLVTLTSNDFLEEFAQIADDKWK